MPDGAKDPHEHFIKQRRNLVLISVFLILINLGGIEFKDLSILGNTAKIHNPNLFYWLIVLSSLYLLWRYDTASASLHGSGKIQESISSHLETLKKEECKKIIQKYLIENKLDLNYLEDINFSQTFLTKNGRIMYSRNNPIIFFDDSGNPHIRGFGDRKNLITGSPKKGRAPWESIIQTFAHEFDEATFEKFKKFIFFKTLINRVELSEYIFPYFLYTTAFITIIIYSTKLWF